MEIKYYLPQPAPPMASQLENQQKGMGYFYTEDHFDKTQKQTGLSNEGKDQHENSSLEEDSNPLDAHQHQNEGQTDFLNHQNHDNPLEESNIFSQAIGAEKHNSNKENANLNSNDNPSNGYNLQQDSSNVQGKQQNIPNIFNTQNKQILNQVFVNHYDSKILTVGIQPHKIKESHQLQSYQFDTNPFDSNNETDQENAYQKQKVNQQKIHQSYNNEEWDQNIIQTPAEQLAKILNNDEQKIQNVLQGRNERENRSLEQALLKSLVRSQVCSQDNDGSEIIVPQIKVLNPSGGVISIHKTVERPLIQKPSQSSANQEDICSNSEGMNMLSPNQQLKIDNKFQEQSSIQNSGYVITRQSIEIQNKLLAEEDCRQVKLIRPSESEENENENEDKGGEQDISKRIMAASFRSKPQRQEVLDKNSKACACAIM